MGYCQYWAYRDSFSALVGTGAAYKDIKRVLKVIRKRAELCGVEGTGRPEITPTRIRFNGYGCRRQDHFRFPMSLEEEAFAMRVHGGLWDVCETLERPYSLAVRAVLLVLKHHMRDALRLSEANYEAAGNGWADAESLIREVLGYRVKFVPEDTIIWRD